MANSRLISLDEVVASAFLSLDIDDSRDEVVFKEWIYDAELLIGVPYTQIKDKCVKVENCSIYKPCDLAYLVEINLLDQSGGVYPWSFEMDNVMCSEQHHHKNRHAITISEGPTCYNLSSNAERIEKAELKYYSIPFMDEEGEMMVPEDHKTALIAYIEYMYIKRERNRDRTKIPVSEVDMMYRIWLNKQRQARGKTNMPNGPIAETIARRWNSALFDYQSRRRNRLGNWFWNSYNKL